MSTSFFVNGKQVTLKANSTFEDIFDDHVKVGKFIDKVWKINGQVKQILKSTKINQHLQGGEQVECLDKNQANNPTNFQPINQPNFPGQSGVIGFTPQQQPPSPFVPQQQPQSPFMAQPSKINQQPPIPSNPPPQIQQKPLNLQDALKDQANKMLVNKVAIKRQQIDDTSGPRESPLKTIKGYKVQIKEFGKIVTLESEDGSFKATFLEENASETEQDNIVLSFNDIIQSPETQLKLAMGRNPSQSTKVLFLTGFKGIAIKWVTGLQTKFQFWLDE
ncbi:unnamed protein product [Paramecium octaurelia]|uniref:Uncharacterized protein n=1 Tax=Paramecium octaurelia TaxID=43137 RepID=A0A8S1YFB7_PAROT|nr:unnamed protein product [Paramecium octaurelia]CAD8212303.1 unnamed protein product [Paramecium octaurelia]CAD8212305.1 unnamed protein product [Paramecium octaurelia]CAD8212313.1 unnamed protein product [Paramecium octaurelia]CAD8212317.1 unnamed protein product [Paramecium octaurelia]